jgi:hypothetical protein
MNRRYDFPLNAKAAQRWRRALTQASARLAFQHPLTAIPAHVTFRAWCEALAAERVDPATGEIRPALLVDGQPFSLADRPAMAWIYDQLPDTPEKAFRMRLTLMKCAQVGFTVMEMLAAIYFALKFEPLKIGMFLPDMNLARGKSSERFMPIVRTVPEAYERLTQAQSEGNGCGRGEGNVLMRRMGGSLIHFLWTSGKATTESYPMDIVSFDEVQEMRISDMEKAGERLSASRIKLTLMGSTANWPDGDIHYWYQRGTRHRFHTRCPTCAAMKPLDEYFPDCIQFDPDFPDRLTGLLGEYRYVCEAGHWIDDPQRGEWIAENPDAALRKDISIHFHQMLSPTISPREIIEAYRGADDMKNFYNRKLGKPYQDPSQIPVSLAHLNACVEAGIAAGLTWKKRARDTFMGIDQMGAFNVVIIKERLPDGRQATVHVEEVYGTDPFHRCSKLMDLYGVRVCVVEQLPNFNDAMRFANRHLGRVFLATGYGELQEDVVRWGDAPKLDSSDRRTDEEERTRYTVRIDQYKAMSMSLARLVKTQCLFPDPQALVQEIDVKGSRELKPILKDVVFTHFQRTALVTERINEGERKLRRRVVKVGTDPHFSYANMLCDVAYARAHGTATFILADGAKPEVLQTKAECMNLHGLPQSVAAIMEPWPPGEVCGRCIECPFSPEGPPQHFHCRRGNYQVSAGDPGCPDFVAA